MLELTFTSEVQILIIKALYAPFQKFPNHAAFLRTNHTLSKLAYPIFFQNYPFVCSPFSSAELSNIFFKCDDESNESVMFGLMFENDWMDAIGRGFERFFELPPLSSPDQEIRDSSGAPDDDGEDEEEDEWLNDLALEERGEEIANWLMRNDLFLRQLRVMGREKATQIQHLTITWGPAFAMRGTLHGLRAVSPSIISIPCSFYLPNLKEVVLKGSSVSPPISNWKPRREGESVEEMERRVWNGMDSKGKARFMGNWQEEDGGYGWWANTIKGIRLIVDACPNLEVLKLEDWGYGMGLSEWWVEVGQYKREGLRVFIERPETDD